MKRHPPRSTRTATLSPYTPLFRSLDKEQIDGLVVQVGSPRGADYDTIALTFGLSPFYCGQTWAHGRFAASRSEEHTSELQSLMRISYAGFCLKNKTT